MTNYTQGWFLNIDIQVQASFLAGSFKWSETKRGDQNSERLSHPGNKLSKCWTMKFICEVEFFTKISWNEGFAQKRNFRGQIWMSKNWLLFKFHHNIFDKNKAIIKIWLHNYYKGLILIVAGAFVNTFPTNNGPQKIKISFGGKTIWLGQLGDDDLYLIPKAFD